MNAIPPTLVVHGLWDSARRIAPLVEGLQARGLPVVRTFDLKPRDGSAPIAVLAEQVRAQVDALLRETANECVDLVGFSMGALASRYYLQRCNGRSRVRRFVSISGPHAGTWMAYALPLQGAIDMRPGSALLRDLASDTDPFGATEVHCLYTPFDLMIQPPKSSILPHARSVHVLRVPMHRMMITRPAVMDLVARLLLE